jgi:hypothetical protein
MNWLDASFARPKMNPNNSMMMRPPKPPTDCEIAAHRVAAGGQTRLLVLVTAGLVLALAGYFASPYFLRPVTPAGDAAGAVAGRQSAASAADVAATRAKAEQGDPEAQRMMGLLHVKGEGVKVDYAEAARWYRLAADQGHTGAQIALGELYEAGQGVPQDSAQAVKWYRAAAEKGDPAGQYSLAVMYLTGNGTAKDDAEALKWYRQSAAQGYALAIFHLGVRYKKGQGVPQDPVEACKWLDLAAARGIAEAVEYSDELKKTMTREQLTETKRRVAAFAPQPATPAK